MVVFYGTGASLFVDVTTHDGLIPCPACSGSVREWLNTWGAGHSVLECDECRLRFRSRDEAAGLAEAIKSQNPSDRQGFARTWLHLHRSAEGEL